MNFLRKMFSKAAEPVFDSIEFEDDCDQVIVHFQLQGFELEEVFSFEEVLEQAVEEANVGEFDGNEIATDGSDGFFYMAGPDARAIFKAIKPHLAAHPMMRGAKATLQFHQTETEEEVEIDSTCLSP